MHRVLFTIISPDRMTSLRWQRTLQREGWTAEVRADLRAACPPDGCRAELLLLDLDLPECRTGEAFRHVLKARTPVSALTFGDPQKVSNAQIALLLESGADDFIYSTLDDRVLIAKLKAHIRRIMPAIEETASKLTSSSGDVQLDKGRHAVKLGLRAGKYSELDNLTQKEFAILSMMVNNEGRIMSREDILEKLWGDGAGNVYSECIDKHIESIRKKLGAYGKRIKTVYGSGYMFLGTAAAGTRRGR
jgi:DNA-binding response OmpR family regulator